MSYKEIEDKLKDIKIEEFVWIIYIGIIIYSFYSNYLERKYYLTGDILSKEKYRKTLIIIFSILLIVYFYFLHDSYESVLNLTSNDSDNKQKFTYLSFIGSLLIFISGVIFLYIAYNDEQIDVELAFN
ncbi:MAG: hypothetical protein IJ068_01665 [Bacilli bacterium]|nr:hypothetical protein [Bacilli bacterium]